LKNPLRYFACAAVLILVAACPACILDRTIEGGFNILGAMNEEPPLIRPKKMTARDMITTELVKDTNSVGMEFVLIPPGTFTMGSSTNELQSLGNELEHQVILTRAFYIQTTEVTQKQWLDVMGNRPSQDMGCGDQCPVENISWNDAFDFIQRLNQMEKTEKYRLPTEAEWEYACRAGTTTPFAFGKCLSTENANYDGRYPLQRDMMAMANDLDPKYVYRCAKGKNRNKSIPVASLAPNAWGLYDMHGNVAEYCQDFYALYPAEAQTDPKSPMAGEGRVLRGGSWASDARYSRSASRRSVDQASANYLRGFRVVMEQE